MNRRLLLDRFQLSESAAAGDAEASIAPIKINNDPNISFRSPFEYIYARYDRRPDLQVNRSTRVEIFMSLLVRVCFSLGSNQLSKVKTRDSDHECYDIVVPYDMRGLMHTAWLEAIATPVRTFCVCASQND